MEKKMVRPAMTPEARDILDGIHETIGAETRSESIVKFMEKNTELGVELCAVKVASHAWERRFKGVSKSLANESKKRKGWMAYSAIVAAYALGVTVYCLIQ